MSCPFCGAPANWRDALRLPWEQAAPSLGWERRDYDIFSSGVVAQAVKTGASYERRKPTRPAAIDSDVVVPALQSLISGIVAGTLGGAIAAVLKIPSPWISGLGAGAAGLGLSWLITLNDHRATLWEIERIIRADMNGDGAIGKPNQPSPPVQVEVVEKSATGRLRRIRYVDLPDGITDDQLSDLAEAVLVDGVEFSRRRLPDGLFSPDQYSDLVAAMVKGGLLAYQGNGPQAGVSLEGPGRAFLRQYLR